MPGVWTALPQRGELAVGSQRELFPASLAHGNRLLAALLSGGDSRIAVDPITGTNKYFCPPAPAPEMTCFSSCTGSPIPQRGLEAAAHCYGEIAGALSSRQRTSRMEDYQHGIKDSLLRHYGAAGLAQVILRPSGTDALLAAALFLAAERPGEPMTAIIPSASETGTGVPLAAACRRFDGPAAGSPLTGCASAVSEVQLRSSDGQPLSGEEVNRGFAAAVKNARGRPVVFLTHSSKTGLVAPTEIPEGADVIVDACQGRITSDCVAAYLRRGWPVAVTGSKFFGGPAFSGAVLLPRARLCPVRHSHQSLPPSGPHPAPDGAIGRLGMLLRWQAAIGIIEDFGQEASRKMTDGLRYFGSAVTQGLASIPALVPVGGLPPEGSGWAGLPSIFTFGVRDPSNHGRMQTVAELRGLHRRLAQGGILLGQPVDFGRFGGLRIAIGAQDLMDVSTAGLERVFAMLEEAASAPPSRAGGRRPLH